MNPTEKELCWLAEFAGIDISKCDILTHGEPLHYFARWNPLEDWNHLKLVLDALVKKEPYTFYQWANVLAKLGYRASYQEYTKQSPGFDLGVAICEEVLSFMPEGWETNMKEKLMATNHKCPNCGEIAGENHICKTTKTCSAGIICPNCGEDYDSTTIHICPPDAAEKLAEMIRPQIPGRFYNESGKYRDARAEYEDRVLRPTAAAIRDAIDEQTYDLHHARNCLEDDLKKLTARVKRLEKQPRTQHWLEKSEGER